VSIVHDESAPVVVTPTAAALFERLEREDAAQQAHTQGQQHPLHRVSSVSSVQALSPRRRVALARTGTGLGSKQQQQQPQLSPSTSPIARCPAPAGLMPAGHAGVAAASGVELSAIITSEPTHTEAAPPAAAPAAAAAASSSAAAPAAKPSHWARLTHLLESEGMVPQLHEADDDDHLHVVEPEQRL